MCRCLVGDGRLRYDVQDMGARWYQEMCDAIHSVTWHSVRRVDRAICHATRHIIHRLIFTLMKHVFLQLFLSYCGMSSIGSKYMACDMQAHQSPSAYDL